MLMRLTKMSPKNWRLVVAAVTVSVLAALLVTVTQLYLDYRHDLRQIEATFEQIELVYLPAISNALWTDNRQTLQNAINGLVRLRVVQHAAAIENGELVAAAGHPNLRNSRSRDYAVTPFYRGDTLVNGSLTVTLNGANTTQDWLQKFWVIFLSTGMKTLVGIGLILWLLQRLLTRHLSGVVKFASRLSSPHPLANSNLEDTDRKADQEDARALLERLTLATDSTNIGIWEWSIPNDTWYASATYATMLGYEADEGYDRSVWLERLHPEDREAVSNKIHAALAGSDAPYQYEARMRHADGSYRWLSVSGCVVERDQQGKPSRMLGMRMDVTERKQAEDELRHNEERIQTILRATSDVIWDWDLVRATLWWNENFMHQFGYQVQDIEPGIEWWISRIHPDDQARIITSIYGVIDQEGGRFWKEEYQFRRQDGSYAYIFDRGYVIRDDAGKPVRMVGAMVDLSERKLLEDRLRQQLEELMRWQEVVLGREDRVQELKKETNALLVRLGLPIRYPSQSAS